MRKYAFICTLVALSLLLGTSAWSGGRLNFMLVNLTGQDIVDAKICPTYFPKYESENLLKKPLDSHSRIYIGPNYYGEQKYWNIALKWANGHEHTFTRLGLTRYNTYTVYSTPQGVKIRQSYEPSAARYEFGPDAPSYMGAQPEVSVNVSAPEKIDSAAAKVPVAGVEPGKAAAAATPRSLSFADNATVPANALAMKTTVERTRAGKTNTVLPSENFKAGDQVRFVFSPNQDGHVYWVSRDDDGQYKVLFPNPQNVADNAVTRNKEYMVPAAQPLQFGDKSGMDTVMAILSPKPVPGLDKAVKLESEGKLDEASKLIADVISSHEQMLPEMVLEEEDIEDVNEQSQLADGETYFIGTYDLRHE